MKSLTQTVISASRRTDIPAFYMKWFMEGIDQGAFEVVNPYSKKTFVVRSTPDEVHTIVFWSKNFGPFIDGGYGKLLEKAGYHLFFNFTINSADALLEPNVPPLAERIRQLEALCYQFGPDSMTWRFDPICCFQTKDGKIRNNLQDFSCIADKASDCGVTRCITSFMDHYPKIKSRIKFLKGFLFIDPPLETKRDMILKLKTELNGKDIKLMTCCEKGLLESLPSDSGITGSSCIPNDVLVALYGGKLSQKKDPGQRIKDGCGCKVAADIGSYHLHPCFHNCLFCYANPAPYGLSQLNAIKNNNENRFTCS